MKKYAVNEIFYSLQGEGLRAGTANVFLRFAGCNLTCNGGVDGEALQPVCDTEFVSHRMLTAEQIEEEMARVGGKCLNVILTGGEPMLQVDEALIAYLRDHHWSMAIETNGTIAVPFGMDWITVSPKTAEHTLKQVQADEVKYVRAVGQAIPKTRVSAPYKLLSPHWGPNLRENLEHCINLCKENPEWRLSVQQHKTWQVR